MNRIKRLFAKLGLVAASTLFALVFVEIVLRIFGPAPPPPESNLRTYTEYDPQLGWRGRPGARGLYTTDRFSIRVDLNSGGWRDDEPFVPGSPATTEAEPSSSSSEARRVSREASSSGSQPRQIALIGDSFAWGYGVERSMTFGERLEASLPGWRVQSYGVCGYGTDQELMVLEQSALRIRPEIVIVEFAVGNDIENILATKAYRLPKPRFALEDGRLRLEGVPVPRTENWQRAARTGLRDFMTAHVRVYAWARPRWAALRPRLGRLLTLAQEDLSDGVRLRLFAREESEKVRHGWDLAEAIFAAMNDRVKAAGARLVILVVGDRLQVEDSLWADALRELRIDPAACDRDRPDRHLEEIGRKLGIAIIDPLASFRSHAASGETLFIPDDPHWNAEGHRLAAEALLGGLRPIVSPEAEARRP